MTPTAPRFVIPEDLERVPTRWPLGGLRLTSRELGWLVVLGALELALIVALVPSLGLGPLAGVVLAVPALLGWSLMRVRLDDSPLDSHLVALGRYWMGPRFLGRRRQPLRRPQRARFADPLYRMDLEQPQPVTIVRHGWGFLVAR